MSFESLSERLTVLQESNAQLKDLIDRLATINFQPGSIPLDNDDGNVATELTAEIHQTLKDQEEDFDLLQEEVYDIDSGKPGSELQNRKNKLDQGVKRGIKELKMYVGCYYTFDGQVSI
jgi:protein transport protein SEC20